MAVHAQTFSTGLLDPNVPTPAGLRDHAGQSADARFDIYRNNVTVSLTDAVEAVFPAVSAIVGRDFFRAMAREYVRTCPPRAKVLARYGHDFADFVSRFAPAAGLPFLADVARLERAWLDAYIAADAPALAPQAIASVDPEQIGSIRFVPHPALRFTRSRFAVRSLFDANRAQPPHAPVGPVDQPQAVMVTRPQLTVMLTDLAPAHYAFLGELAAGQNLELAAQAALARHADLDIGGGLAIALSSGAFTSLHIDNQDA